MSLTYAKDAVIKGFVGVPDQLAIFGQNNTFADANTMTPQQQVDKIFSIANCCKDGTTIFADDKAVLPVSQPMMEVAVTTVSSTPSAQELTTPPNRKKENHLMTAFLVGVGVFALYKILE